MKKVPNCKGSNTPCGGICLTLTKKCRIETTPAETNSLNYISNLITYRPTTTSPSTSIRPYGQSEQSENSNDRRRNWDEMGPYEQAHSRIGGSFDAIRDPVEREKRKREIAKNIWEERQQIRREKMTPEERERDTRLTESLALAHEQNKEQLREKERERRARMTPKQRREQEQIDKWIQRLPRV